MSLLGWAALPVEPCARFARSLLQWNECFSMALKDLPFESGSFFAFVPPGLRIERAEDLEYETGSMHGLGEDMWRSAFDVVSAHLQTSADAVVMRHAIRRAGDPGLSRARTPWVVLSSPGEDFTCHVLRAGASYDDIEVAFSEMRAFVGVVALTYDTSRHLHDGQGIRAEAVRQVVESCAAVLFEAFDGWGYIAWNPRNHGTRLAAKGAEWPSAAKLE